MLIFVIGWFVASLIRKIVTGFLKAGGLDAFAVRMGMNIELSRVLGLIVYVLVLIPAAVGALNALSLSAVSGPLSAMLNTLLAALPNIFAAALILVCSYVLGHVVAGIVTNVFVGMGFEKVPSMLGFRSNPTAVGRPASHAVGTLCFITILLFGLVEASHFLGFAALSAIIVGLTVFGSHLLMGLIIFV